MSKQLNLDEMLEIITDENWPEAAGFKAVLETVGTSMAQIIGGRLNVSASKATSEGVLFAGTCAAFGPLMPSDPIPTALEPFDEGADWD